jgi:hypothetical protein
MTTVAINTMTAEVTRREKAYRITRGDDQVGLAPLSSAIHPAAVSCKPCTLFRTPI